MIRTICMLSLAFFGMVGSAAAGGYPVESHNTGQGELRITLIGHASLMLEFDGQVIHVDPWLKVGDYAGLPKADLVLITHDHRDHADAESVLAVRIPVTELIGSQLSVQKLGWGRCLSNGQSTTWNGIGIEAVPAYNQTHKRENGAFYHPKGEGNGYVLRFGEFRVYIAGDTEDIPELAAIKGVDVAFLPVNLPFTMTPEMLVNAAKLLRPKVLYPYHTGDTDMGKVAAAMSAVPEVRTVILPMR